MDSRQKLVDRLIDKYMNHPVFIEYISTKYNDMVLRGKIEWNEDELHKVLNEIYIADKVRNTFPGN